MNRFQKTLKELENQNRLRSLKLPHGIDFTSNDYLCLKNHPELRRTAIEALESGIDIGAGGSRLLRGNSEHHEKLESFAAVYFGAEKALYFSNGFQANAAIFDALPDRHDVIIFDEFVHASAREAIQHSPASHIKVRHNNLNDYESALKRAREKTGMIWVAVESVYSMDGDLAPLGELQKLAVQYDAMLVIDEAHGTGIFGQGGKGLSEFLSTAPNLITLHTCGKAMGVAGGIVTGAAEIIDTLVNRARGFIYSTAPIPLQCILVQRALELMRDEPWRREKLFEVMLWAKDILPVEKIESAIVPIILGEDARALAAAEAMQSAGFDVRAIRPPTVPEGTARLRVSLNCGIEQKTLIEFSNTLNVVLKETMNA
jgi:8-amino-7-oxononanoate synthase